MKTMTSIFMGFSGVRHGELMDVHTVNRLKYIDLLCTSTFFFKCHFLL
ncbi:hypothetical protein NC651_033198 [Populus alba x Populus x berolinensis]|nr:hypothetical protein NC651_033198 [Populus alba x Populus x berolinensis]